MSKSLSILVSLLLLSTCVVALNSQVTQATSSNSPLYAPSPTPFYVGADHLPLEKDAIGTVDVLVILLRFTDIGNDTPQAEMEDIFFEDLRDNLEENSYGEFDIWGNATPLATTQEGMRDIFFGDLRDNLVENSYGKFDIRGNVTPWVTSVHSMGFYGQDGSGIDDANGQIYTMVQEAINLVDPFIDFNDYDSDGNGRLDQLYVIHAGMGQEISGNSTHIWSHYNNELYSTADGIDIDDYATASMYSSLGVIAHEFGHLIGLLDLYDTDGSSYEGGTGQWCMMSTGVHNDGGAKPSQFCGFSKVWLGWVEPTLVLGDTQDIPIYPLEDTDVQSLYKIPIGEISNKEYFLVSMRQDTLNETLYGEGILIWHIDENVLGNANDFHRMVNVEQRDNDNNPGNSGDVWRSGDSFTDTSAPNSRAYNGDQTNISVYNFGSIVSRSSYFSVVVSKAFHAPVAEVIPNHITPLNNRHISVNLEPYASDDDGDVLNWSFEGSQDERLEMEIVNKVLMITILGNQHFLSSVTLRVTDVDGLFDTTSFNITVLPFDQPPTVIITTPFEVKYGTEVEINTTASYDIDSEIVSREYFLGESGPFILEDLDEVQKSVTFNSTQMLTGYLYHYFQNPIYLKAKTIYNGSSYEFIDTTLTTTKPTTEEAYSFELIGDNLEYFTAINWTWVYVTVADAGGIVTDQHELFHTYSQPGNHTIMVVMEDEEGVRNYALESIIVQPTSYYTPVLALVNFESYDSAKVGDSFTLSFTFEANENVKSIKLSNLDGQDIPILVELYKSGGVSTTVPLNMGYGDLILSINEPGQYVLVFTVSPDNPGDFSLPLLVTPYNPDGDAGDTEQIALIFTAQIPGTDGLVEVLQDPLFQATFFVLVVVLVVSILYWRRRRSLPKNPNLIPKMEYFPIEQKR